MMKHKQSLALAVISLTAPSLLAQSHPLDLIFRPFPVSPPTIDVQDSRDVVLADFDNDGDLDLLAANMNQKNALYLGNKSGAFTRHLTGPLVNDIGDSRGLAVGDIDRDGDIDVFVATSSMGVNFLYENKGGLVFERRLTGPVATDKANSRQAEFGDVDGDGDLDLYVTNFNAQKNFLYINQGGAQGGTEGRFDRRLDGDAVTDTDSSYGLDFGDVDADGDLDLFVANHSGEVQGFGAHNWLYLNDGTGLFTRSPIGLQSTSVNNSLSCAFADMDNDGDLDLFVGNTIGEHNQIFLNDGTGDFDQRPQSVLTEDRGKSIGVGWFDGDNDGDLDVLVCNRSPQIPTEFYVNRGNADFLRQGFGPLFDNRTDNYDCAIGDIDEDGHPDVALANVGSGKELFRNAGRQWENLGGFLAGTVTPTLSSEGNFLPSETVRFALTGVPVGAKSYFLAGVSIQYSSFLGGTLVLAPAAVSRVFMIENDGPGDLVEIFAKIPPTGLPSDLRLGFQAWIEDGAAPMGYSATNGLRALTP